MSTIKDKIRAAKLPGRAVPVCLNLDLQDDFEAAERELHAAQQRPRDSLAAGSATAEIAARIEALRQQMQASIVEFRLRAAGKPAWRELWAAHPPRKDPESGEVNERDKHIGVNVDTFFDALIKSSVIAPVLDDDDWRVLLGDDEQERTRRKAKGEPVEEGKLTDRQIDELANAAWNLNRRDVDVPFSFAASRILASGAE